MGKKRAQKKDEKKHPSAHTINAGCKILGLKYWLSNSGFESEILVKNSDC